MRLGSSGLASATVSFSSDLVPDSHSFLGERKARTTVLVIDADLGFSFWLGQSLDAAGHNALPVRSASAAWELIRNHRLTIDVVVIDPLIPHAPSFLADLRRCCPNLKVVTAIPEHDEGTPAALEFEATRRKPQLFTEEAALQWINLIQMFSDQHRPRLVRY